MERAAACVRVEEPVLLVGETARQHMVVQQLAQHDGHTLVVHNLNHQSNSSELLGGFRPQPNPNPNLALTLTEPQP